MENRTEDIIMNPQHIQISNFTYDLPDEKIAKYPLGNREESKLLVYKNNEIKERGFQNLPEEIAEGTTMVFNNTKVIQARLIFYKETGARVEIFVWNP